MVDRVGQQAMITQSLMRYGTLRKVHEMSRYAFPAELDLLAQVAGLELVERYEGWSARPFEFRSQGHVSVYRPSASRTPRPARTLAHPARAGTRVGAMFVEDLILLSATVHPRRQQVVAAAAAATVLAELVATERVMLDGRGDLVVLEAGPTGDDLLDDVLTRMGRMGPGGVDRVAEVIGPLVAFGAEQRLTEEGVLQLERTSLLGVTTGTHLMVLDRDRLRALQQRLVDVLTGELAVDARSGTLVTVLSAAGWLPGALGTAAPGWSRRDLQQVVSAVARGRWVAEPLSQLVARQDSGAAAAMGGGA